MENESAWDRFAFYKDWGAQGWMVVIVGHTPRTPPGCGQHEVITFSDFMPTLEAAREWARPHMATPH